MNKNERTMTSVLKSFTSKARAAMTRADNARYSLALVLHEVKESGAASDYLSKSEVKELTQGQTSFSVWYQTELELTSDVEVSQLISWVQARNDTKDSTIGIGVAKALASVPARHGKTATQNVQLVHKNAQAASKSGKATVQGIGAARKELRLTKGSAPSTSKSTSKSEEPTVAPPEKLTRAQALNQALVSYRDDTSKIPATSKSDIRNTKELITLLQATIN